MNQNEKVLELSNRMLCPMSEVIPLSLDILNNALCVCLSAKIIASYNEGLNKALTFKYWNDAINNKGQIKLRDFLYDVVYPKVPPDLRNAVDFLRKNEIDYQLLNNMMRELFTVNPNETLIQSLVDHIADYYYPLVINEPINTPTSVNKLCVSILQPKRLFYDGTCGVGATCVEVGKYSKNNGGNIKIYAQEKIPVLCSVLTVRAFVHDIHDCVIRDGDVLTQPIFMEDDSMQQFDYSIMFPPLGMPWTSKEAELLRDRYNRFDASRVPKSNSEWLFVMHMIASLKERHGRGIIAVSTGTLYNAASSHLRKEIISKGYVECIITLPSKILHHTTMPLSLVVINKDRRRESAILMIQAEDLFSGDNVVRIADRLNEQVIEDIVSMYRDFSRCKFSENSGISRIVTHNELIENDFVLLPSRYVNPSSTESEFGQISIDFGEIRTDTKICDIAQIYRGLNVSRIAKENKGEEYKVINYADVQNGRLNTDELKTYKTMNPEKYMVQAGDVLVSCKGVAIKTCIVPNGVENTCLSLNFIGIRPHKNTCNPRYLKYYLDSPAVQSYLKNRQVGTSIITLKNSDLAEIPIFLPPLDEQMRIIEEFESFHKEINDEIKYLYKILRDKKWNLYTHMGLDSAMRIVQREGDE